MNEMEIEIGDEVRLEDRFYVVKDIKKEEVKTIRKGTIVFTRLYFDYEHAPVYSYSVKEVRKKNNV